jgi:hypothetical protein
MARPHRRQNQRRAVSVGIRCKRDQDKGAESAGARNRGRCSGSWTNSCSRANAGNKEAGQETPNGKHATGQQVSRLSDGDHLPPRPIFATMKGTPLSLNNVLNRQILPVLNACVKCGKVRSEHGEADHEYERDSRRPEWHGWHAFRRGLATNLHDLGVDDKTIQAILRHANVAVTQGCYIKTLDSQSIAAMQQLESLVDVKMLAASQVEA